MAYDLASIQDRRAEDMARRRAEGEDIPEAAMSGLMIEEVTKAGNSRWILDKDLSQERRAVMESIARELGERDPRLQIANVNINGEVESAKSKLMSFLNAEYVVTDEPEES